MFRFDHHRSLIPLLFAALAAPAASAAAEPAPPAAAPASLFRQIIKDPTGKNGCEELLQAGDALSASRLYRKAAALEGKQDLTLALKHEVLLDPPVMRALALLRRGLAKPVSLPEPSTIDSRLAAQARFRELARLLYLQQYVLLADGRVADAIANARLGLRLGDAVQTNDLLSGTVGVAISMVSTGALASHMDQWSARDCEMLYQVCVEWLRAPSPLPRMLEGERRVIKQNLAELKGQADDATVLQAEKQLNELLDRQILELGKPAWERAKVSVPEDGSVGAQLAQTLLPPLDRVSDGYTSQEARIGLLACHAAIRRYRWEHDRLPDSLAALNLAGLAVDPFTGQPLRYERQGARYRLTSAGPAADADDPKAINGRRPVSIGPSDF